MDTYLNFLTVKGNRKERDAVKTFLSFEDYPIHPKSFLPITMRDLAQKIKWGLRIDLNGSMGWSETKGSSCLHFTSLGQQCNSIFYLLQSRFPDTKILFEWSCSADHFHDRHSTQTESHGASEDWSFCNKAHWTYEECASYLDISKRTFQNKLTDLKREKGCIGFLANASGNLKGLINRDEFLKWVNSKPQRRGRPSKTKYD